MKKSNQKTKNINMILRISLLISISLIIFSSVGSSYENWYELPIFIIWDILFLIISTTIIIRSLAWKQEKNHRILLIISIITILMFIPWIIINLTHCHPNNSLLCNIEYLETYLNIITWIIILITITVSRISWLFKKQ